MKKLYLDHNILIELMNNKINHNDLSINNHYIVYSPAHIEEIAVSEKRYNTSESIIKKDLDLISTLTENKIILPHHGEINNCNHGTYIKFEHPKECYARVTKNYSILNDYAETINENVLVTSKKNNFFGQEPSKINNILPEKILIKLLDETPINNKKMFIRYYNDYINLIREEFDLKLEQIKTLTFSFSDFEDNFFKISTIIEMLANLLESNGYHYEKSRNHETLEKARSRMHDVSHIIYGSYVDRFIIGDKKLFQKTKAIYSYLNIKTEVLYYNQKNKHLLNKI